MRRLASVFGKRSSRTDGDAQSLARVPTKLSLSRGSTPSIPVLTASHTSSASSASIRTPDVEGDSVNLSPPRPTSGGFWKRLTRRASSFRAQPKIVIPVHTHESEEEHDPEDDYGEPEPATATQTTPTTTIVTGKDSLLIVTQSKMLSTTTPAPCLLPADGSKPAFPSSCHQAHTTRHQSFAARMFRIHLVHRLDSLSPEDEQLLANFPRTNRKLDPEPLPVDSAENINTCDSGIPKAFAVSPLNPSIRQWITRPCFEDRFMSIVVDGDSLNSTPVSARFAVAALEYSEQLDLMAPPELPQTYSPEPVNTVSDLGQQSHESDVPSISLPVLTSSSPSSGTIPIPIIDSQPVSPPSPVQASASDATVTVRRGVRFAEDGKDDIPLGYVVRRKQQQAAKAKFLLEEKEKRAFEVDRARMAEERRRRDQERAEWERERKAWEDEKRAIEEERRQRQYAANFAAARQRQEHNRYTSSDSPQYLTPSGSNQSLREIDTRPSNYKRHSSSSNSPASQGSSPGTGSRPGSFIIPSPYDDSRSPSPHSSSSEDSKAREARASRRMSSTSHSRAGSERSMSYPTLSQQTFLPPVPPVMGYFDMPLVPPTPPFVLQQYPKRQSRSPGPSSPAQSKRVRANSSAEQLINTSSRRQSSSASPQRGQGYKTHHRQSSGDNPSSNRGDDRGRSGGSTTRRTSQLGPSSMTTPVGQYGQVSSRLSHSSNPNYRPLPTRRRTAVS